MNYNLKNRIYELMVSEKYTRDIQPRTPSENNSSDNGKKYTYNAVKYASSLAKLTDSQSVFEAQNTKILGLPHQFLETADFRIDPVNNNFGYCFATNIYMERPIVTLMPGKVNYLPDFSNDEKRIIGSLMTDNSKNSQTVLRELISDHGETRYYDFASDYSNYITYVNLMCRVAAVYLNIDEEKGPDGTTPYRNYHWANYQSFNNYSAPISDDNILKVIENFTDKLAEKTATLSNDILVGERSYVNFYIDPSTSVNESLSNTTQKSQLEGEFDSVQGIVKEASMLLNSISSAGESIQQFMTSAGEAVLGLADTVTLGLFKNMLGLAEKEVLHGANLIYPEIWTDSEYSKSYSIQMNLVSPYGTKEAVYLNVLVPMFHALCLALPRQSSANSFSSPFIIRGFSKGRFSIDMGMVESITIDKGPENTWTVEGLPTQVKITLNIKDLYSQLMMSPSNKPSLFFSNQGLMDYLGCVCGVDLSTPNIVLKLRTVQALLSSINDIPNNAYLKLTESLRNNLRNFLN